MASLDIRNGNTYALEHRPIPLLFNSAPIPFRKVALLRQIGFMQPEPPDFSEAHIGLHISNSGHQGIDIADANTPYVADAEAIALRQFAGIDGKAALVQLLIEHPEVEGCALRIAIGGDDMRLLGLGQIFLKTETRHAC